MMNITVIGVTKANIMDVITDDSVYVIKKNHFGKGLLAMVPVLDVDVKDLLSEQTLIVKITNE